MIHLFLIQIPFLLALGAWASPLPAANGTSDTLPLQADLVKRQSSYNLAPEIIAFDMATHVTMFGTPATDTNVLSKAALTKAQFPPNLAIEVGAFTTAVDQDLFKVRNIDKFTSAKALLQSAQYAKKQALGRAIYGEADLTQVIFQGLAIPVTEILRAVFDKPSTRVFWHGTGRGSAPIPDMIFQHGGTLTSKGKRGRRKANTNTDAVPTHPGVVMEIKTTDSMPNNVFDEIMANVPNYLARPDVAGSTPSFHFLTVRKGQASVDWDKRQKFVIILEQILGQMFSNPTVRFGLLTNLENWIVLERKGDTVKINRLPGIKKNGHNNGLDIMLAASLAAIGPTGVRDLRGL